MGYKSDWNAAIGHCLDYTIESPSKKLRNAFYWTFPTVALMVLTGSLFGFLFFFTLRVAGGRNLSGLVDSELQAIIKGGGRECSGCSREKLLELASELSEKPATKYGGENDTAAPLDNVKDVSFDEIQDILDDLREKIENDKREHQENAPRPDPGELDAMAKELQGEFLKAFEGASSRQAKAAGRAADQGEKEVPLEKLSEDDARFKVHKVMSGEHGDKEKPRRAAKVKKETPQSSDYVEIAKTLAKKYSAILMVNLGYYSRVGAVLGREYGSLLVDYTHRYVKSLFHYSRIYGGITLDKGKGFTRYACRKARNAAGRFWDKLVKR